MRRNKAVFLNIIANIVLQLITIVSGFVVPRIILSYFGSESNGLVSSLSQFLSYINLIEGGVGGVIVAGLYKPLLERDYKKISSVMATSKRIYRRLGIALVIYSIALTILYPLFTKSSFSFEYISTMVIIVAFQMFTQYYLAMPYQQLLRADKKVYVFSFIQSIIITLNIISFAVLARVFPSLHLLKIITGLIYIAQPIALSIYVKKHYRIDKKAEFDSVLNESKWDGFIVNIAWIIHTSTDVAVLTILTDLITVSVYTVHNIVANGLRKVLLAISAAIIPSIGHLYAKGDKELLRKKFDTFEFYYFALTAGIFTVASLLINPFVGLYTGGIDDASYSQPLFAYILIIAEFIYCIREPYYGLAQAAGKFKDMRKHACIEASLNLAISIVLIQIIGLPGVAIGTLIGNMYRTTYHILYLKHKILFRPLSIFIKKMAIFAFASACSIVVCLSLSLESTSISTFIASAVIYSIITIAMYLFASLLFFRKELMAAFKQNGKGSI